MSNFYQLSQETISDFEDIFKKKAFPVDTKFQYLGNAKQKRLIEISKINDKFCFIIDKELLVSINEDIMMTFDDESVGILFEQEIDKISINLDSGKIKMVRPDLTTFSSLITKYGIEKVARANSLEDLYGQQKQDAQEDII
jgi:hypothetical protein